MVRAYQRALLEVVEQNDTLKDRVSELEKQLAAAQNEIDEKDGAIIELAALLD
jgi:predicted  nucleic acid-binding Zn-ribbon protein